MKTRHNTGTNVSSQKSKLDEKRISLLLQYIYVYVHVQLFIFILVQSHLYSLPNLVVLAKLFLCSCGHAESACSPQTNVLLPDCVVTSWDHRTSCTKKLQELLARLSLRVTAGTCMRRDKERIITTTIKKSWA